jgi:hypothetical protein
MEELASAFERMTFAETTTDTRQPNTKAPFPFMRLPKELRLAVYELVFQRHIDEVHPQDLSGLEDMDTPWLASSYRIATCRKTFTMFHVNRIMRKESFDVCYRLLVNSIESIHEVQDFRPINDPKLVRARRKTRIQARETRLEIEHRIQMSLYTLCVQHECEIKLSLLQVRGGTSPRSQERKRHQQLKPLTPEEIQKITTAAAKMDRTTKAKMFRILERECASYREGYMPADGKLVLPMHVQRLLLRFVRRHNSNLCDM